MPRAVFVDLEPTVVDEVTHTSPVYTLIHLDHVGPDWNVSSTVPPGAADHWEGGRCQQLCPRPLHHREGADRGDRGQDPEDGGPVLRAPGARLILAHETLCHPTSTGIPHLPLLRGRHWVWIWFSSLGTPLCRVWEEVKTWLLHLPSSTGESPGSQFRKTRSPGVNGDSGALQCCPLHSHHP